MKILMDGYCVKKKRVELRTFAFLFDGKNLRPEHTIEEAGLEDGDEIDALAHQLCGGLCRHRQTRFPKIYPALEKKPLYFYMSAIVEVCDLAAKVLKKPKLCKCGLAELDKEVRINSTVACTASSRSSCPVMDSKDKVEKASLPDSNVKVEIASFPDSKVTVEIASLPDSKVKVVEIASLPDSKVKVEIASLPDSKVTVEIASLPDLKVNAEITSLPDSKVKVEKASLPEMIECILDWKAVAFSDEEIKPVVGADALLKLVSRNEKFGGFTHYVPLVAGVYVKFHNDGWNPWVFQELLVLCGWNRCLIIHLYYYYISSLYLQVFSRRDYLFCGQ
ncbi:hypothetical protein QYF36_017737 [Acer negundo]|nr:hypothetical protein QYF36_017737 [Acer negundo]